MLTRIQIWKPSKMPCYRLFGGFSNFWNIFFRKYGLCFRKLTVFVWRGIEKRCGDKLNCFTLATKVHKKIGKGAPDFDESIE
jgi:hypothetical protein